MREAPLRIRIMGVRRTALAAGLAALVAVPIGLLALEDEGTPAKDVLVRGPVGGAPTAPPPAKPAAKAAIAPTPYDINGPIADRARALPDSELTQIVRTGSTVERLAALHVLWNRGSRAEVEALVAESESRELKAKLKALRARTK